MKGIVEITNISEDDSSWRILTDQEGLREFLSNPTEAVSDQTGFTLVNDFHVNFEMSSSALNAPVVIEGRVHIAEDSKTTSSVLVRIDPFRIGQIAQMPSDDSIETHNRVSFVIAPPTPPAMLPTSYWTNVATYFPSPINMTLVYRPGTSNGAGLVEVHMELQPNPLQDGIAAFIQAVTMEPLGYQNWLNSQTITQRQFVNGTVYTNIMRPVETQDTFRTSLMPLRTVFDSATSGSTPAKSCNSSDGNYAGDPTQTNTTIDIASVYLKWY